MITIVHLSDFHMNNYTLYDWENYLKDSMIEIVKSKIIKPTHTFIVCAGDLIDRAGKDLGGVESALSIFKEKVIDPVLDETGISLDHFVIIPGNHDINREMDDEYENMGLIAHFNKYGYRAINDYATSILNDSKRKSTKRCIEYKKFEQKLYDGLDNVQTTFLGTSFRYEIDGLRIGIAAYNSAWCAYDDNDFENGMYLSEPQFNYAYTKIKDCDIKIALMHHPLDWLKQEKDTVCVMFYQKYDMLLSGHVHNGETTFENKMYGALFSHVAPCFTNEIRNDSISFANGFTILEYDSDAGNVKCSYYSYKKELGKYSLNNNYADNGLKVFSLQNQRETSLQNIIDSAVMYVKTKQCPKFDESLIPQRAKAIQTVKDAFVTPPIVKQGNDGNAPLCTINDIIKNPEKVLLFGPHESGKSILLYRIIGEYVDNYHQHNKVPVYIDFKNIGNQDIETIIKIFIDCSSKDVQQLLNNKSIVILLDNYAPSEEFRHNVNKMRDFVVDYKLKVIATSESSIVGIIPISFSNGINSIAFENYFIDNFKAENVKQLMSKWAPTDETLKRNMKIEKMVTNFCSYSLPCTAMSVSLYLWSTENAEKEPINQSVLLDIYIEIMLEKMASENIYHNNFDYHNKTMLLSKMAFDFYERKVKEVKYGAYIDWIDDYLKSVGYFQFDASRLGDYLIQQKIIKREGNVISFAHSCFYYFFLAKRMFDDTSFYNRVVSEDYYSFDIVIGYYSGLKRNDKHLLTFIYDHFNKAFEPVQPIYDEVPIDKCFTQIRVNSPHKFVPQADKMTMTQIIEKKPDEKNAEQKLLEVCDNKLNKISDEFRKNGYSPDGLIVLLSKVLKNLDGVEDVELKQNAYNTIIRNTLIFAIIYKDALANYANKHNGKLPEQYSNVRNVDTFFRFMPFAFQWSLNELMGTTKLCYFYLNKLNQDYKNGASDVEKYMSLAMLWDSANFRYEDMMKKFIKDVDRNSAMDYVYTKLLYNYYYHVKKGSKEEEMYEELIIRLKVRKYKLGFMHKDALRTEIKESKMKKNNEFIN